MSDFLVKRSDLRECRVVESLPPELETGQALLRVDTFGLTANNVTYGVFGEAMSYWDFFPTAEDGWGRVPMWGFAEVERSEAEGVEPGARLFGYLPPSSHLLVTPAGASEAGFVDASPHRAELPSAYHRYLVTGSDSFYRADTEEIQMLLRPLFFTSFLIDDQLADEGLTAGPIAIASASSKTALAAAFMLAQRDGVELIGLTSPGNTEFVESLGVYGRTVGYDAIETLEQGPITFVDIAGNGDVRRAVHSHFGDDLLYSMAVGMTHWEEMGAGAGELPGPQPIFFFAPTRVSKRAEDWGRAGLESRVADAWHPFCEWAGGWLETIPGQGFDALQSAYLDVLEGQVDPKHAHVLTL